MNPRSALATLWLPLASSTAPSPVEFAGARQTFCTRPSAAVATRSDVIAPSRLRVSSPAVRRRLAVLPGGRIVGKSRGRSSNASGNGEGMDWLIVWFVNASSRVSQAARSNDPMGRANDRPTGVGVPPPRVPTTKLRSGTIRTSMTPEGAAVPRLQPTGRLISEAVAAPM